MSYKHCSLCLTRIEKVVRRIQTKDIDLWNAEKNSILKKRNKPLNDHDVEIGMIVCNSCHGVLLNIKSKIPLIYFYLQLYLTLFL